MRLQHICAAILTLPLLLAADTPPDGPKSPAARSALTKYANETKRIDDDAARQKQRAAKELIDTLKKVQADVMKAGGAAALAEGNAIQGEIDQISSTIGVTSDSFVIDATKGWQPTITVTKGQVLRLRLSGEWCANVKDRKKHTYGPNSPSGRSGLEARVGGGQSVEVRDDFLLTAAADGVLEFRCDGGDLHNNDGSLNVQVLSRK